MKHSLGKIVFFLLCTLLLQAEDFNYHFNIDNPTPYTKEAVLLTLDLNQTNPDVVLLFDFDLVPSDTYHFQRVGIEESDAHHALSIHYTYLLYPLHAGEIAVNFKLTKKVTTDDSVAYSFSGDRDNVKGLVTEDYPLTLPAQILHSKPLPEGTQLVGDFSLDYTLKKHQAKAYETLPLQVTIKGKGYPPILDALLPNDGNFTLFTEKPIVHTVVTVDGSSNTITYPMALSHSQSFNLSEINLKAFNPKTETSYLLTIPSQTFNITQVPKAQLVDKIDNPPALTSPWEGVQTLFSYLIVFMAGYLSALAFKWQRKPTSTRSNPLKTKILATKETKTLLQLLMATDAQRFASAIETLEHAYTKDAKINLSKVKEEAIDLI